MQTEENKPDAVAAPRVPAPAEIKAGFDFQKNIWNSWANSGWHNDGHDWIDMGDGTVVKIVKIA